jgi:hypothetical protein
MYKVIPWTAELDLTEFYTEAARRGFENNASQKSMVDCFAKEKYKQVWILYHNSEPVGSVAAHSFPEMGEDAYRIAARTCVFTDRLPGVYGKALRTISVITDHQNPTAQFLIPTCIAWTPPWADLYITSNENSVGTQRLVHNIFAPAMEHLGLMKQVKQIDYRGTRQTVWQLFPDRFLKDLENYHRWPLDDYSFTTPK